MYANFIVLQRFYVNKCKWGLGVKLSVLGQIESEFSGGNLQTEDVSLAKKQDFIHVLFIIFKEFISFAVSPLLDEISFSRQPESKGWPKVNGCP